MCGIYGGSEYLLNYNPDKLLKHRGPNQYGQLNLESKYSKNLIIGNTRLSIVDREPIKLPLEENGWIISFNGEIYNWREIRKKLEFEGHKFLTNTDTEVVLKAIRYWGEDALDLFNGMFAIAIWDGIEIKLIRDRAGIKPIFYSHINDEFSFASEIKAFTNISLEANNICDTLGFYFDEYTPYSDIKSLKPGEIITWNTRNNSLNSRKWWSFPDYDGSISDEKKAVDEFLSLFFDACKIRNIADVPVTVFQSGGIDSSLIQAVVRSEDTFTVEFNELKGQVEESKLTLEMSSKLEYRNHIIIPDKDNFINLLPKLAFHIEYKVNNTSIYPIYCLNQEANKHGYKVALTGEGADELFNGYFRNELLINEEEYIQKYNKLGYGPLANRYFSDQLNRITRMYATSGIKNDFDRVYSLLEKYWQSDTNINHNLSKIEFNLFLQPLLTSADRMSMANSVELRNPFLDFRIINFSRKLVPSLRYKNNKGKNILRLALRELLKDEKLAIFDREVKQGLPSPINSWLFSNKHVSNKSAWNNYLQELCFKELTK